jgi:2-oxoglutarate dehydrogenase E1 component
MNSSVSARFNTDLLDQNYAAWKLDPSSVDAEWSAFFEGFEIGTSQLKDRAQRNGGVAKAGKAEGDRNSGGLDLLQRARIVSLVYTYRSLGHTGAQLDPLHAEAPDAPHLSLEEHGFSESDLSAEVSTRFFRSGKVMTLRDLVDELKSIYCGRIGFEYMHIHNPEVRHWLRDRIENRTQSDPASADVERVRDSLTWLTHAEAFEQFLHRKYVGQKRFSLEGGESLIVALNGIFEACSKYSIKELVMGMAHRGRLNVLANLLHKPLDVLLYEFSENYVPNLVAGDGDVKYHLGFDTVRTTQAGDEVAILLAANPSHLEAVNPVVEGKARARQRALATSEDERVNRGQVLPLLIHGDAAFAGQGSVPEVLNLSQLPGYRTGGTVHLVVNNQIGFTTMPEDARSSDYCTDVAKMIEAPVIHVNGDSPLDVLYAAELALEFRQEFGRDVVVDIVCYRRHGHNEGDEPAFTQPKTYKEIRSHESTAELFRKEVIESKALSAEVVTAIEDDFTGKMEAELNRLRERQMQGNGSADHEGARIVEQPDYSHASVPTGIDSEILRHVGRVLTEVPEDFQVNEKIRKRFLEPRRKVVEAGTGYNWAFAESLAFGSLLMEGKAVRLSGQDCRRGTFSQRHAVLYDSVTRDRYVPLRNLADDQGSICIYNSLLSEYAVLGFDYGYSLNTPDMLILWEAQFGDFANGAQVIIDQFISSAESKWGRPSHLTMLLPHGYEGQGPEHSSARLERFLQLCAEENMQVCNLTTPAQYFHVLRRQLLRDVRKPLILMTPKSLLNHPSCVSSEPEFTGANCFREILDDPEAPSDVERVSRLVFCSGKVYYDLAEYRRDQELKNVAIIRIEQLYPLNRDLIREVTLRYPNAQKWVWCQEEPQNMGAWSHIEPRLDPYTDVRIRYAGRDSAASPAAGAKAIHVREQKMLVRRAFSE